MVAESSILPGESSKVASAEQPCVQLFRAGQIIFKRTACRWMQILDTNSIESQTLKKELQRFREQRLAMARIRIKVTGADDKIFWIRCFEHQQATRTQHSIYLIQEFNELGKLEMLDQMKGCDCVQAFLFQTPKVLERVCFNNTKQLVAQRQGVD